MSPKKWLAFFGASALAVAASVAQFFPQTVGLSAPLSQLAVGAHEAASAIPDQCDARLCAGGAVHGLVGAADGGASCECP